MAGLEAQLRITAKDDAGGALATLKAQIEAIDKQVATFDKLMKAVGKIAPAADPMIKSIAEGTRALEQQKAAVRSLAEGLGGMEDASAGAVGGQERLRAAIVDTSRVMVTQGAEAMRVVERIVAAQRKQAAAAREGGLGGKIGKALPFLGPGILHRTFKGLEEGASLDNVLARIQATNLATPDEIAKARSDYLEFSKTHTGVTEADYLSAWREAISNAPKDESFHLARQMATIKSALRNSGVQSSDEDNLATIRAMDELGFKTEAQRDRYLNETTKMRQIFGDQIKMGTYLSAIQNAHAAAYDWSDAFKYRYLPTLLQMSGEQGGTQIATGLSNYVGQHMQQSELRALAAAGFVGAADLRHNKIGDVTGLKHGAHLFEESVFKSNIVRWALDFHREYMKRKGATEAGFSDLVARMPRNMGGLIQGIVHGASRFARDAGLIANAPGRAAASDSFLSQNPGAALLALDDSIQQFGAVVTGPAVKAAAPALTALAQAIKTISSSVEQFEKAHPTAATAGSTGAVAALLGAGGWLTGKLLFGLGKLLGFGGAAGATAGGAAVENAAGSGFLRVISATAGAASLPALIDFLTDDHRSPQAKANDAAVLNRLRSLFFGPEPVAPLALPGARPASPVGTVLEPYKPTPPQSVSVSGQAQVEQVFHFDIGLEPGLRAIVDQIGGSLNFGVPLNSAPTGRMDTDAAPVRGLAAGIGHQ